VVVGDGKISTRGLSFFYPEQGSAEFCKKHLNPRVEILFSSNKQTLEID